jgi:tRNA modification GTPase
MKTRDTIFAVSTGAGRAGIAIVRLSGAEVVLVIETLCGSVPKTRFAALRKLRSRDGEVLDEAMVLFFAGPNSVTGEDVGEFHVHGSPAVVERLLMELGRFQHCRPAQPGEFTRRAYENERMDLVEVEGLADLLAAESEPQRQVAMRQFSGEASSVYLKWHRDLVGALAMIEASIDFADEDGVAAKAIAQVRPRLLAFKEMLEDALEQSAKASLVRRGLRIVIAGAPNVGKSSLLNALAGRSAAIVSDVAGTTRDVVEASVMIEGLPVSLADTAGLRLETSDAIEQEGMLRSRQEMRSADILLWLRVASEGDAVGPDRTPDLLVYNKSDLGEAHSIQLRNDSELAVSVRTGQGLAVLKKRLSELVLARTTLGESAVMVRARHRLAIEESIRCLNDAAMKPDDALELLAEDVRRAAAALASITGRVDVEEFLGRIFQEFCVGK